MELMVDTLISAGALLGEPALWLAIGAGLLFGVVAGALPGIGTTLAYALVLPFTFSMDIVPSIILLMSITVGVQYGNSIPAILLGVPGTPAAVLTVLDGHTLHKQGKSGLALGLAFISAVAGQYVSTFFFMGAVIPLAAIAYLFLSPEIFALHVFGIVAIVSLTGKNILKGLIAASLGLTIAFVGLDPVNFQPRFTFGMPILRNGIDLAVPLIGFLAVSELFRQTRQVYQWHGDGAAAQVFDAKFPKIAHFVRAFPAMLGGTIVGTIVGAIPGAGATPAAMISYQQAQLVSRRPEEFGRGSLEGIAANESSQNASSAGELIPTLGFGIPGSGSMVLLLAALTLNGFVPGPNMIRENPELLHAVVAGLLGSTTLMLATGWPMALGMLKLLTVNRSVVVIVALGLVSLGIFSLNQRVIDVVMCFGFGAAGYFMLRYGYSVAAAALAVVLAPGLEANLRRGLSLFDASGFFGRPITLIILVLSLLFLIVGVVRTSRFAKRTLEPDEVGLDENLPGGGGEWERDTKEHRG